MTSFPLILDGFPRCGSTTLARILSLNPDINCCIEPFHPKRYGGEFHRIAMQAGTVAPALQLLKARWNALKHVWEPVTAWPFKDRQDLNDDLIMHAEIVVSLRRRNLLRQIVSNHISKYLQFWIGTSAEFKQHLNRACLPPLSVADANKMLEGALAALERRDGLLRDIPGKQLVLYYEDFFNVGIEQQIKSINRLFVQIDCAPMNEVELSSCAHQYLDPSAYKWADDDVYDRIPGIRLVDEQLGSDCTGWIFQ